MSSMSLLHIEAPTLALPRKRRREVCVGSTVCFSREHGREWESRASTTEPFLLTLLRLRGREGEGVRAEQAIRQ